MDVFEEFTPTCEAADCGRALDADRPALVFREEAGEQRGATRLGPFERANGPRERRAYECTCGAVTVTVVAQAREGL